MVGYLDKRALLVQNVVRVHSANQINEKIGPRAPKLSLVGWETSRPWALKAQALISKSNQ